MKYMIQWVGLALVALMASAFASAAAPGNFAAEFVQTRTLPGFDQPLVSHGEMRFSAETGFHWEITQPYHYVFDMKDGIARELLPDGTTRTLTSEQTPWLKAVERLFVGALSGDREDMTRHFKLDAQALEQGRQVTLTPKPGAMAKVITQIRVTEDSPGHPRRLVIDEVSGAHMDIRFTPINSGAGQ